MSATGSIAGPQCTDSMPPVSKSAEEAGEHYGWLGFFVRHDVPASSVLTQERLKWRPVQPGLIADLNEARYFEHTADAVSLHG
jgi:hypothetical protein